MPSVKILDCTLRDGGYINNFNFGKHTVKSILKKLGEAKIDIIECGFLSENGGGADSSVFGSVEEIGTAVGVKQPGVLYVAMIALGEKEIAHQKLSPNNGQTIDGIRITFHEHEIDRAFEFAQAVRAKGYEPFMQPIGTITYPDKVLLELVEKMNELKPFAFYIVDTLGTMYSKDLLRIFHLVDHNLDPSIAIGFHSHNNLQLSFANAQTLMLLHTKREIFIDSTVFGMGRGAGNLCTELITQYVNDNIGKSYNVLPLLEIFDEHLSAIFANVSWGYSVPFYLAAVNSCHPNYASYLLNKQTITVPTIKTLLQQIPQEKRTLFNKGMIEEIYLNHQSNFIFDRTVLAELSQLIGNSSVLLIAPGKTVKTERARIDAFIHKENPIVVTVNFKSNSFDAAFSFISNGKRWERIKTATEPNELDDSKFVFTSNLRDQLPPDSKAKIVDYRCLLSDAEDTRDNAGLMAINLMIKVGCQSIYLAGFDGFTSITNENFYEDGMNGELPKETVHLLMKNICESIIQMRKKVQIQFITTSQYDVPIHEFSIRRAA